MVLAPLEVNAISSYDPDTGEVTIDYIVYGRTIYSNVIVTFSDPKIGTSGKSCQSTRTYNDYNATTRMRMARLDVVKNMIDDTYYCDVEITIKDIISYSDETPVEIFTNTYNYDTNTITIDTITSGRRYNHINDEVSFLWGPVGNPPVEFFNRFDQSPKNAWLHGGVNLKTGDILNEDYNIQILNVVTPGTAVRAAGAKTTVLVYMVGSNLEGASPGDFATKNIQEMTKVGPTANMRVILQTGGAKKEKTGDFPVNWTHVQRWEIARWNPKDRTNFNQALIPKGEFWPEVKDTVDYDMDFAGTLKNFIQWGMTTYPADKYILVMWSHSGGINGLFGGDSNTSVIGGLANGMTIPEIIGVIKGSPKPFELIAWDSCLNGTAEIAAGLAPYTKYMAASEDFQDGAGYDYTTFLQQVAKYPDKDGGLIGKAMAGGYYLKTAQGGENVYAKPVFHQLTSSAIDLSKMVDLKSATDNFARELEFYADYDTTTWLQIARARADALDFATSAILQDTYDLVDMRRFVENIQGQEQFKIDNPLQSAAEQLKTAIDKAVVYNKKSLTNQTATGLTVYFPSVLSAFDKNYENNTSFEGTTFFSKAYTDLLTKYNKFYEVNKKSLVAAIGEIKPPTPDNPDKFSAKVTNPIDTAMAALGSKCNVLNPKPNPNPELPPVPPVVVEPCYQAVTDAEINQNRTLLSFNKNSPLPLWPTLGGVGGVRINLLMNSPVREGYGDYLIPVVNNGRGGNLRVIKSDVSYIVESFIDDVAKNPQPIKINDKFTMRYIVGDKNGLYTSSDKSYEVKSLPLKVEFIKVESVPVPDNDIFTFITTDLTGAVLKAASVPY